MTPLRGRYLTVPLRVKQGNSPAIVMFLGKLRTESWEVGDWFTQHYPALPSWESCGCWINKITQLSKQCRNMILPSCAKILCAQFSCPSPGAALMRPTTFAATTRTLPSRVAALKSEMLCTRRLQGSVNLTTPKDASKKVLQRIRRARDGYILMFDFFDLFCCFVSSCLCKGSLFYLFWFLITLITIYPKKPPYVYAISSFRV